MAKRSILLVAAVAAPLAGCTTTEAAPTATLPAECAADKASALVGQPGTSDLAAEAMKLSGARTVRWTAPGMAVTMDYRPDRLNIELDDKQMVARFTCG